MPAENRKFKETKQVFDRLVRASGSFKTAPSLIMTSGKPGDPGKLALFEARNSVVEFSEYVYDTCSAIIAPRRIAFLSCWAMSWRTSI
jgi:hypothetical protein